MKLTAITFMVVALCATGIEAGTLALRGKELLKNRAAEKIGVHDPAGIVWDEFVGFWIAMLAVPPSWLALAVGFALFRLFDIVKPWPIGWLDKHVDGGLGIMLDDIAAGLITALLMAALRVAGWL